MNEILGVSNKMMYQLANGVNRVYTCVSRNVYYINVIIYK